MSSIAGNIKLTDVSCYPNLALAEGAVVNCTIQRSMSGKLVYYDVSPATLAALGCDVGTCRCDYPFYSNEVTVIIEE